MEKTRELTSHIKSHSKFHVLFCIIGLVICLLLIGLQFIHLPLLITLLVTSTVTLILGILGWKIDKTSDRSEVKRFFIVQILSMACWDFGGIICVITIVLGSLDEKKEILAMIIIACCLSYIGVFIYFWKCFMVVNQLLVILNNFSENAQKQYGICAPHTKNRPQGDKKSHVKTLAPDLIE